LPKAVGAPNNAIFPFLTFYHFHRFIQTNAKTLERRVDVGKKSRSKRVRKKKFFEKKRKSSKISPFSSPD